MRKCKFVSIRARMHAVRWKVGVVCGLIAALALGAADPAHARRQKDTDEAQTRGEKTKETEQPRPDHLFAVVSIADQHISFYGADGLYTRSPVSTGQSGHRTPTGVFSIVQKKRYHESNLYSSAPMPFMQRITWSGVAMHEGVLPGYPASHGCIRMPRAFAQRMFGITKVGQRVLVAPHEVSPARIAHQTLPVPQMHIAPGDMANASQPAPQAAAPVSGHSPQPMVPNTVEAVSLKPETPPARLNPLEYAWALRSKANADSKAAAQALRDAVAVVRTKQEAVHAAAKTLRAAEGAVSSLENEASGTTRKMQRLNAEADDLKNTINAKGMFEAGLADAQKRVEGARQFKAAKDQELNAAWQAASQAEAAGKDAKPEDQIAALKEDEARTAARALKTAEAALREVEDDLAAAARKATRAEAEKARIDEAIGKAAEIRRGFDERIRAAQQTAGEARRIKAEKDQELAAAQKVADAAKSAGDAARAAFNEATRRLEPVSIFISRKTSRLYVRQAFNSVFDTPVTIKEPERPIGTHVLVSTEAETGGAALRWWAVTMPDFEPVKKPRPEKKNRRANADDDASDAPAATASTELPQETVAGALDRIEIPEAARQRIAELIWTGASILISDQAMSGETGEQTDFIVLTRGKPAPRER